MKAFLEEYGMILLYIAVILSLIALVKVLNPTIKDAIIAQIQAMVDAGNAAVPTVPGT